MSRHHEFTFKTKKSFMDMNLIINSKDVYSSPARDCTFQQIPGKNGDLIIDNERFTNVPVMYEVTAMSRDIRLENMAKNVKAWLQSSNTYDVLTDTYDPNYFRYAKYDGKLDIIEQFIQVGAAKLTFNCKPFKYSFAGQIKTTLTQAGSINNPEEWPSKPYIKIMGTGNVTLIINGINYVFTDIDSYIEIDSEMMNVFKGITSCNSKLTASGFPSIVPGTNTISWIGSVTSVEIVPRWCCL